MVGEVELPSGFLPMALALDGDIRGRRVGLPVRERAGLENVG